ncbi:MAG: MmcQ/YjbR family DNA-binding protein [Thermoanaerobaculia bacterium]|nr:MmcQ/YjbR family DNA-binding protein [Thermoanaerobaculia bacterium]
MTWADDALERVRGIVAAWPETRERISHGSPTWWGGRRTFASFHDDHHGDGRVAVWVKSSALEQEAMVESDPEVFFVPPYVGPSGWVGVRLDRGLDWEIVAGILQTGYRMVAPKRALDELEPD